VAEHRRPEWARDGSALFVGLRPRVAAADSAAKPNGTKEKVSDVQVWHARDVRIMPMQKVQEQQDLQRTLLAAWRLDGAAPRVVPIGTALLETTRLLDGQRAATETDRAPYPFGAMFGRPAQDVYAVDTRTGERKRALENVRYFLGGSATGRKLLWFDGKDYWTYDLASGARTNLTARLTAAGADFTDPDFDYPHDFLPPDGVAGWARGDGALLVYDRFDVWSLAPDGSGGRRLTNGAADSVTYRYARTRADSDGIDLARPLYFQLAGEHSKRTGYAVLRPRAAAPERLVFEDARVARLVRADSADVFAFTRERFDDSPDWFVGGAALRDAAQASATNPFQRDFAWGKGEVMDFTSAAGRPLQAALFYPANYEPGRRYPMIVYTYERLSQGVHNYVVPTERNYYDASVFTQNGYVVLMPDIVFRDRDPGVSVLEAVVPAVREAVRRGIADSAKVGHVGHSWGGYEATFLPTRTGIFAAGVAGAPITNFLSFAGAIHWTPGIAEFDHWETGQARMQVPPWEDVEAYLRNSPIARVQDLKTPLLMEVGDADGTVDWHQGIEFYNFARRAGNKDFVLLVYPGEDHGLRKKENQIDYHRRINQWFGHWLKGEAAPAWMSNGTTWLERKALLDASK
jgi:dipeptidyl aminopeptidase/acylaminoacyl peptidase